MVRGRRDRGWWWSRLAVLGVVAALVACTTDQNPAAAPPADEATPSASAPSDAPKGEEQAVAEPKVGEEPRQEVAVDGSWGTEGIQAVYTGRYHVSVRPPDFKPAEATPQVIRDQAAFDAFVKTIPTEQIQKKQPAPPSDDPLLKSPRFDWSKQMVLVGFRTDSMYGKVVFKGIKQEGGRLRVKLDLPDLGPEAMGAQPHGVGVYSAIVVERFEGEVVFE